MSGLPAGVVGVAFGEVLGGWTASSLEQPAAKQQLTASSAAPTGRATTASAVQAGRVVAVSAALAGCVVAGEVVGVGFIGAEGNTMQLVGDTVLQVVADVVRGNCQLVYASSSTMRE